MSKTEKVEEKINRFNKYLSYQNKLILERLEEMVHNAQTWPVNQRLSIKVTEG